MIAVLALLGCGSTEPVAPPAPPPQPPDVILVTLDTTRADRLGAYGYAKAKTDTLDAIAAKGRRYERAYSPAPLTIPAHASLFTGRYPAETGVRGNGDSPLPDDAVTLAEVLHDQGYATAASVAAFVTTRTWGFGQGFDAYFDGIPDQDDNLWHAERRADVVIDDAIAWYQGVDPARPRFLWVHLYDAHYPYAPPPAYLKDAEGRGYDGEIAFVDDQVQRLVETVGDRPTIWVFAGDHGEGLGDHGELTHGLFVYEATQRVPLFIAGPGIAPEVVAQPVSLVDVAPTLLAALGISPPPSMTGRATPQATPRAVYAEAWTARDRFGLAPQTGVYEGAHLLVDAPRPELYDVLADPGQEADLAAGDPARVASLRQTLAGFGFPPPSGQARGVADPEIADQLAALGYVDGGFTGDATAALPDAKDHRDLIKRSQRAERLDEERKFTESEALYRELLVEYPQVNEFRNRLAMSLERQGRTEDAIGVAREAVAADPDNPVIKGTLAALLGRSGRHEEAIPLFLDCAAALPYSARMRQGALTAMLAAKRYDDVFAQGEVWEKAFPEDAAIPGLIGLAWLKKGDEARAIPYLERGVSGATAAPNVAMRLSEIVAKGGDPARATDLLLLEVRSNPRNRAAGERLVAALSDAKRWVDLADAGQRLAQAQPDQALFWHAWAQATFNQGDYAAARRVLDPALARHPESSLLVLLDANLLAKEGRKDEGARRFEAAQALRAAGK